MREQKWTYESVSEVIKTCKSTKDLRKRYSGAFAAIKRNGWDDLKNLLPTSQNQPKPTSRIQPSTQWTRDEMSRVIQTCKSGKDFKRRYPSAFQVMKRKGWTDLKDLLPTHSPDYVKENPPIKYTEEVLSDLISRCDSVSTFKSIYPRAYNAVVRRGLKSMLGGMPMYSVPDTEPTLWCVYKWTFIPSNAVYIGLTKDFKKRIKDELAKVKTSPVKAYLDDTGDQYTVEKVKTGLHSNEAAELEREYIAKYRDEGYLVLNRHPGGSLGGYKMADVRSDEEILAEIFSRFNSYNEFRLNGASLYTVVCQRNLYERVWERLPKKRYNKYDNEYLESIIKTCTKFSEFKDRYPSEYKYMSHKGICSMLSGLDRTVEKVEIPLPEGFDEAVDLVNMGKLSRKEAADRFGMSVTWFVNHGKGRLKPASEVRKRKTEPAKVDWEAKRAKRRAELIELVTSKYKTLSELRNDHNLHSRVKRNGIYGEVSALLEHKNRKAITKEDILAAVGKCTSYVQFMREYGSEYSVARRMGWEYLLEPLPRRYKKPTEYTLEYLQDCVRQCTGRKDFNTRFPSETYIAKKRGIYDELVKDLPKQKCTGAVSG